MDVLSATWPPSLAIGALVVAAAVIGVFGWRLTRVVDRLADRTGLGEAIAGAVLLAGANSLAGMVVSVVAAASDSPSLAVSNSVGGIAAQTAFIVIVDLAYRPANLEHAAASLTNIFNSMLMIVLLAIVVIGATAPPVTLLGVHPATPVLLFVYGYGVWISRRVQEAPMWRPKQTRETSVDEPDAPEPGESLAGLWIRFAILGATVTVAGFVVARSGLSIIEATGLSGTFVGAFFTAVAASLPELATAVAAVRTGALTLAVGGIVGANTFDVLIVGLADVVFRRGSLYAETTPADLFVLAWTMLLVGVMGAGLVRRQRRGIGFEGAAILLIYLGGLATVSVIG